MRRALIVTLGIAVLGWVAFHFFFHRETPAPITPGVDSVSTGVHSVQLWFASPSGDGLTSEARDVVDQGELHERVAVLIAELERGPGKGGVRTLPTGTALLHVYLDDRGLMTLDLSRAFQQNFHGGTGAENLAIGSLVRTVAGAFPEVKQILIVCGGTPIASLGGHLPLDRPLDVADWP